MSQPRTFTDRMIQHGASADPYRTALARQAVEADIAGEIAGEVERICLERGKSPESYADKQVAMTILQGKRPDLFECLRQLRHRPGARESA